jgi:rfaE bifunctional protein kinase chain/domain
MTPLSITSFRDRLPNLRVLVVGDLMLDRYLWGHVSRISPEAPVPVVDVSRIESRPGGAANVALNLGAMGAQVAVCGVVGNDDNGKTLLGHLQSNGFNIDLVKAIEGRITTAKTRVIGNNQQILRVDHEVVDPIPFDLSFELEAGIVASIADFDAVIFEDYDKGLLSPDFIRAVTDAANQAGVPSIVDPKFSNFLAYSGVTLFKPNLKELNEALGIRVAKHDLDGVLQAVEELRLRMPHENTLITLSEHGVIAVDGQLASVHIPAHFRKITDVSGAGDTVVAVMALGLAAGLPLLEAAEIANLAGGLVCEEVGVVPVDRARLFSELLAGA